MFKSAYTALVQYEEVGGDMIQRIHSCGLTETFSPLVEEFGSDMEVFNQALFYLLHCYSLESEYHILNTDWALIKNEVAKRVGIDIESTLYEEIFYLKNVNFTRTVRFYLVRQGSRAFKHLVMVKDLYEQMVNSAIENILDSNEKVNYDQKMKNAEHARKLYLEITEWEQRIETSEVKLTKAIEQIREVEKKSTARSLRMEDNLNQLLPGEE